MRIAVVSSGLGHIARGIEACAVALAKGLANPKALGTRQQAIEGIEVTLFGAEEISRRGAENAEYRYIALPCLKRGDLVVRLWVKLAPGFTWRWGWKSTYAIEQKSFAKHLIRYIKDAENCLTEGNACPPNRREDNKDSSSSSSFIPHNSSFSLIHTQDPVLALELERARKLGKINVPVILAHGTDDSPEFLRDITYLQHLCLKYREKFEEYYENERKNSTKGNNLSAVRRKGNKEGLNRKSWVIPNFVDTERYFPKSASRRGAENAEGGENRDLREELGIPGDALVIGCSAALQFSHKRLDYLIKEVSVFSASSAPPCKPSRVVRGRLARDTYLLLAGASTNQTPQVEALANELLGDHCKILKNVPLAEMPDFYRALDIYVHPAYDEFYGVSILEAMASGLPVVAHASPSLTEQVFAEKYLDMDVPAGGVSVDMKKDGAVAELLEKISRRGAEGAEEWAGRYGRQARERAEKLFSWEAVEPRFMEMYRDVVSSNKV